MLRKAGLRRRRSRSPGTRAPDRKSTRLNSSHTEIYTLSLHDALPIFAEALHTHKHVIVIEEHAPQGGLAPQTKQIAWDTRARSEEHTSELQSHRDLHSFPTRRSSDLRRSFAHAQTCNRHRGACSARRACAADEADRLGHAR